MSLLKFLYSSVCAATYFPWSMVMLLFICYAETFNIIPKKKTKKTECWNVWKMCWIPACIWPQIKGCSDFYLHGEHLCVICSPLATFGRRERRKREIERERKKERGNWGRGDEISFRLEKEGETKLKVLKTLRLMPSIKSSAPSENVL